MSRVQCELFGFELLSVPLSLNALIPCLSNFSAFLRSAKADDLELLSSLLIAGDEKCFNLVKQSLADVVD
jgi:hypothetical protein